MTTLTIRKSKSAPKITLYSDSHLPNWGRAETSHRGLNKRNRRALEVAYIITGENINISWGYFKLSRTVARPIRGILRFDTGI